MKVLERYIAKTVILDTLLVLLALLLLRSVFAFMDEGGNIGRGNYEVIDALYFILLQIPARLYDFFPVSALIGGLIGIGRLASHSELIVMRSVGLSMKDIGISVLKGTFVLMILVFLIGELITPRSSQLARQMQTLLISGGNLVKSSQGVWVKNDDNYVHIRIILPEGRMEGVTQFQFEDEVLKRMVFAQTVTYQEENKWLMQGVKQTFITETSIASTDADSMIWKTDLTPDKLGVVSLKPEDLNILGLAKYNTYLEENGLNATRCQLALWKKVFQPFAVAVMMFLALSFISGPLRTVTVGARILMGIIVGYGFQMLSDIFGPVSLIYQMPPLFSAILPIIVFGIVAGMLLKKAR